MIHREGRTLLFVLLIILVAIIYSFDYFLPSQNIIRNVVIGVGLVFFLIVLQFFRNPSRNTAKNPKHIIAPADGKVVVIEEAEEPEYFKGKRKQISIFMSPFNVHVNRMPAAGSISYFKYHPGKYLVAWHPKSSTENERTTVVVKTQAGTEVLFRQIAGALARRIKWYVKEGDKLDQGQEFGFIKFGSRVDIYLPLDVKVNVNINDVTTGGETVIAELV
ncbi:phosphatidylserine decarboxylase family protein [Chryseotalea sanaruensis]|uniref:Phosphatidylserine decarboxylase proenzyme n=1 Tax=Chryseotalea sanaruensis TaxID=2482724 RepID=A0A401U741_9BACT|nr:phosphatidylserine decarboxylase family protein [Chryseotalea sanaruensis]GCC50712.1 phosphatidylserine decarboxylase family protein [Chryseotalea sanaruensis]